MVRLSWQKILLFIFVICTQLCYGQQYTKVVVVGASIVYDVYGDEINTPNIARTAQWNQNNVNVDVYGFGTDNHTIQDAIESLGTAMDTHPTNTLFMVHIGGNNVTATRPFSTATINQRQAIEADYDALYASIPPGRLNDVIIMPMTFRLYNQDPNVPEDLVNNPELGSLPFNENILIPKIAANAPAQMNIDGNPIVDLYHFTFQDYTTYFDVNDNDGVHPSQPAGVDALSQFMSERAAYFINNGPVPPPLTPNISVTGVGLTATNLDLALGDTDDQVASVLPNNATNTIVNWTSSDTAVATVDATGKVTALVVGTTTITVTTDDGGFTANVVVNVFTDSDGDGISDDNETNDGTDANAPCDPAQTAGYTGYDSTNAIWSAADCDLDGVSNGDEFTNGTDPYLASGDTDGDGLADDVEINDGTNINDTCDPVQVAGYTGYDSTNTIWSAADCDTDGVINGEEFTNGTNPYEAGVDTDGDGVADDVEINDGTDVNNSCDPAQQAGYTGYDATNTIWTTADCDLDGVTNGDELTNGTDPYQAGVDTDGDGISDDAEINDGTDTNNACDPAQTAGYTGYDATNTIWSAADCDLDGVTNGDELTNGTDPYQAGLDTDGDGVADDAEINDGTDANDPCDPAQTAGYTGYDATNAIWAAADCDLDGVTNGDELTNGTDPYQAGLDTDGDGISDDVEINDGTDTNGACDPVQVAGYIGYDSTNAIWSVADCDADGVANGDELNNGTDPYMDEITNDEDNDGQSNDMDNCPSAFNPNQEDFDGDGIGDVCDDDRDNDGILDLDDNCDATPEGAVVNAQGCEINLASDNFEVKTLGETCVDSNDGGIEIRAQFALEYTATLQQEDGQMDDAYAFSDVLAIDNLPPGTYILCITTNNSASWEQCYTSNIGSVEPLAVVSETIVANQEVRLSLSGAEEYNVELNGEVITTTDTVIVLPLSQIENRVRVTTDAECQGAYEDILVLSKKGLVYPNPVDDDGTVSLYIGGDGLAFTEIIIYDTNGSSVFTKTMVSDAFGFVHFKIANVAKGMYFVTAVTRNDVVHQKLLKK